MAATIHQLSVSPGGVPKLPIDEGEVTELGLEGDAQAHPDIHGGPRRALCLFPLEVIERLRAAGHAITPGGIGENITTSGLDWSRVTPGAQLRLGAEVVVEVTSFTNPCATIARNFTGGDINLVNQKVAPGNSRVYARVIEPGRLSVGDGIEVLAAAPVD